MTIELSLRRRATQARCFAIAWLSIAVLLLGGTYVSLPLVAEKTLDSINKIEANSAPAGTTNIEADSSSAKTTFFHLHVFAMTTLALGVSAIALACYLLGRSAFMEMERAGQLCGFADALCISGDDFERLEKAATLLVPKAQYLSTSKSISADDLKDFAEVLKNFAGPGK